MPLKGQKLLIIGGSAGIGKATAVQAVGAGAHVVIAARSKEHLAEARDEIGGRVDTYVMDVRDPREMEYCFAQMGGFDHLVVTASYDYAVDVVEADVDEARKAFDTKVWGQFTAVQSAVPFISEWGSITLFSGISGSRVIEGRSIDGAANAAVESLVRSLAVELRPLRINAVAPGDLVSENATEEERRAVADRLPTKRVGEAFHAAQAVLFLMENPHTTGVVLRVDGGGSII